MNTEGALDMISRWREKFDDRLRVGAGTVVDLPMAKEAVAAGAEYMISPNLDEAVIEYGLKHEVDVYPGTMTPTEIVRAWKAGAKAVKVFPMGALGVDYLKEIRAPLRHIPMIATGGVNVQNIRQFIDRGALGVGIGGSLVDLQLIDNNQFDQLTSLARKFTEQI